MLPMRKQNPQENPTARRLFDFCAPLALEECVSRLGSLQEHRPIDWAPTTTVRIERLNPDTYTFAITEHNPAPVRISGYLNRLDEAATYVSGEAASGNLRQWGEVALVGALVLGLSAWLGLFVGCLFFPPLGVFAWMYYRGTHKERDRLLRVTRDTLGYP